MGPAWLILADDLTGAADTAIAFARRRLPAKVVWGEARPEVHMDVIALAYDCATREHGAALAARRHSEVARRFLVPGMRVFKKIDSTLRGHPAEEIAAMLDVVLADEEATRVVLAPAFPAMGRTVREGQVLVEGVPLQFTEYWPEGRDAESANLVNLIEDVGVAVAHVPLAAVRADATSLRAMFAKPGSSGRRAVAVCDAETDSDLERIATAALDDGHPTFFIGSAGLAHALALYVSRRGAPRRPPDRREPSARGALVVVGSRAKASRAALAPLSALAHVQSFVVDPALLAGDLQSPAHAEFTREIGGLLASGVDVVVSITPAASAHGAGNPQLVSALARLLAPTVRHASAIVATGGETAAAILERLGVVGLRLLDEIEPGIPLGLTLGELSIPAVTKAGGFGDEDCLMRIITRLRFIRQTGTVV